MYKNRPAKQQARFQPRVEPLEQRCLLDAALPAVVRPTQFTSAAEFRQYLLDTALDRYKDLFGKHFPGSYYYPGGPVILRAGDMAFNNFAQTVSANGSANPSSFSQTNVQVAGVDEGDLVKTDGTYLYEVNGDDLNIVQAVP